MMVVVVITIVAATGVFVKVVKEVLGETAVADIEADRPLNNCSHLHQT